MKYLIACALKSGHEYKGDWSHPGRVYAAVLPGDLSGFDGEHQLKLEVIRDGLVKNHGYYRVSDGGIDTSVISAEQGVFQFIPPEAAGGSWEIRQLLDTPASDAVLLDMDGDGEKELAVLSPFHGDCISIYKRQEGIFQKVYQYGEAAAFVHAIYGGTLCGVPQVVVGHRQGKRNLIAFYYDRETGRYQSELIDRDCGPANVFHYIKNGKDVIISANREIDQVAMYTLES